jgi:hypothetical protein
MSDFNLSNNGICVSSKNVEKKPSITTWLINKHIVTTESQAAILLVSVTILSLLLIGYLNWPEQAAEQIEIKYYQDIILEE